MLGIPVEVLIQNPTVFIAQCTLRTVYNAAQAPDASGSYLAVFDCVHWTAFLTNSAVAAKLVLPNLDTDATAKSRHNVCQ